jgi:hypothetical protein
MLQVDEDTMQNPLKEIDHLDLALPKVPTKALYKLQISVTGNSIEGPCRCYKFTIGQEVKKTLEMTLNQVQFEREEAKQHTE